jgi:hypothetical protein
VIEHLERFLDATVASLRTGLPAAIATINAQHTDFQLDTPDVDAIAVTGPDVVQMPFIEVAAPSFEMLNLSLGQEAADLAVMLMVRAHVLEPDPSLVQRRCMRYGQALLQVLMQPDAFGPSIVIGELGIRGSYVFDLEAGQRQQTFGTTTVVFALAGREMRS